MSDATLHIGRIAGGERFDAPPDVQTLTIAALGVRGSGKSTTARVIVEGLLGLQRQVVIIDPTDVWWGIKSSSDGKRPGHPVVIFGGSHGDLPLDAEHGQVIADFLVDHPVPAVLSLRHLRKSRQRHFVTDFAEQLYHRKGEARHRTALQVVIDECDLFIPQRVGGAEARMVGAIEDLVRRGRAAGLGVALISQRAASINKDVLTQVELLIAHRHTSPQDVKALDEWVRLHDTAGHRETFLSSLASLPRGTAYFWSPEWLDVFAKIEVRRPETFDSSATPGSDRAAVPDRFAEVDLDAVRSQLQQTLAEAEASDPKRLKARIAELERELAGKPDAAPDPAVIEAVAMKAMQQRDEAWRERVRETRLEMRRALQPILRSLEQSAQALAQDAETMQHSLGSLRTLLEAEPAPPDRATSAAAVGNPAGVTKQRDGNPSRVTTPADDRLRPAHQRILDALAWLATVGITAPDRSIVAAIAGVSPRSSSFRNDVSRLSSLGLLRYPGSSQLMLTEEGHAAAHHPEAPPTLQELHDAWRQSPALRPAHVRLLDPLIEHYPGTLSREALAGAAGVSVNSSSFRNDVSRLSSIGLVEYPSAGLVQASRHLLFPEGLR